MPASMIMAPVGSSRKVSGSSIAMVAGGPSPGSTPITVPSTTPRTHMSRFVPLNATWNPCSRPWRISMPLEKQAPRQRDPERDLEEQVETQRAACRDEDRSAAALAAHHLDDEPREEREGDREAREGHEGDGRGEGRPGGERAPDVLPLHLRLRGGLEHRTGHEGERQHEHRAAVPRGEESRARSLLAHVRPPP